MCGWVPLMFTWNYHNIFNWLYPNTKLKVQKKKNYILSTELILLFSRQAMCNSSWPHILQNARLPSLSPGVLPNFMSIESVMPSNHLILCHPLLLLPSIFPSIRVFFSESAVRIRWPSTGASASVSVLSKSIQDWFTLRLTGLFLLSKGLSRVFSSATVRKHQFFGALPSLLFSSHICTWLVFCNFSYNWIFLII